MEIESGMTLSDYVNAFRGEKEKEKLEKQRRKKYETQKQGDENNMMLKMLQSMKEAFDVMRFDQINTTERLSRMEEKRVYDAVKNERLRRIEEGMAQQNLINQRLLKVKPLEMVMPLEVTNKSDVDMNESSGSETQEGGCDDGVGAASDLIKQEIKIYDSVISAVSYHELINSVRFAPKEMRKQMSLKAYIVYRVKSTPLNVQSGDCGIYTLNFIECLGLRCGF